MHMRFFNRFILKSYVIRSAILYIHSETQMWMGCLFKEVIGFNVVDCVKCQGKDVEDTDAGTTCQQRKYRVSKAVGVKMFC